MANLKKTVTKKVGGFMADPFGHKAYKLKKIMREGSFLQDYNQKSKRGVPISNQDHARFQMIRNNYKK